jgi:cellulose synthase/poly-beta-1,6-N-acetylglucosamine synthase-like glycosyltransferase
MIIEVIFWGSVALVTYAYLLYPVGLFCWKQLFSKTWSQTPDFLPDVSTIIAVRNGAPLLRSKIANLSALDYPKEKLEIIAVSDGSVDDTDLILREFETERFKVITYPQHRGKASALNLAMKEATGEILFFTDVRPSFPPDALRILVSNFSDASVGCVGGELSLTDSDHDVTSRGVGVYWKYEQLIRVWESAFHSSCGMYGGFYAVRRNLAVQIPDGTVLDDIYQPMNVIRQGYRAVIDMRAKVSDVWPTSHDAEFKRKVRTLSGNFQLLKLCPWLLWPKFPLWAQFISHKLLRLLVPWSLVALLGCTIASAHRPWFLVFLIMQLCFYLAAVYAVIFRAQSKFVLFSVSSAFCTLNWAAVVALFRFCKDPSLSTIWEVTSTEHVPVIAADTPRQNY